MLYFFSIILSFYYNCLIVIKLFLCQHYLWLENDNVFFSIRSKMFAEFFVFDCDFMCALVLNALSQEAMVVKRILFKKKKRIGFLLSET